MSTNSLDDLLSDTQGQEATQAAQPEAVAAQAPEPKGEPAAPPAASQEKDDDRAVVPRKALEDERHKRQEYERKVREYEDWFRAQQQAAQPQPKQPEPPDPYIDPVAAFQWQQDQFNRQLQAYAQKQEHELVMTRVNLSEQQARLQHSDYDEVVSVFVEAAQANPRLLQTMASHPNPAAYAYEIGRKAKVYRDIGDDPTAYEKRLREKWEAEAGISQPQPQAQAQAANRAPVPRSLASTSSAKPQPRASNGQFAERAPLEDLIG